MYRSARGLTILGAGKYASTLSYAGEGYALEFELETAYDQRQIQALTIQSKAGAACSDQVMA